MAKIKKEKQRKQQVQKPVVEVVKPLPATRMSDDLIPKKVSTISNSTVICLPCLSLSNELSAFAYFVYVYLHRANGRTNSVCSCLPLAVSTTVIVI